VYVYLPNPCATHASNARFTVGFFDPFGAWRPESDYPSAEAASQRVHFMNGGAGKRTLNGIRALEFHFHAQQADGHAPAIVAAGP
jgi:hypothetical protein